ncbi:type II secretion system GspH family protein [Luteolibacter arcticus]|uniref:Type II secretion system GspH family protein n=1 Tax=Luteolibacter arcticus TaxID=1581411 RepID=A0ABT3GK30_9BACT|nr:type II secretion system protein [Luteolibacter arcticus]MCW1923826.1 type II secretion system GspH family protein [Luteolibacter arcticus]
MKKPKFGKRAGGFTLVELMVCIVIVIALAAMVFALTKNAMAKSRLAASSTRVRDLGVRVQAYTQDNAGQLPVWKDSSQDLYWWGMLVKDPRNESELEIFHSPGHDEFSPAPSNPNLSYGWNARVVGRTESAEGDDGPKRMANFKEPARILVLADGPAKNGNAILDDSSLPDPERYNGKAAGLLLDGSARQLEIERDFKGGQSVWLMTEEEREAQGK